MRIVPRWLTVTLLAILPSLAVAAAPIVTTQTASVSENVGFGNYSAILSGSVGSGGAETTAWFRIATTHPGSCDDSFGIRAPASGGTTVPGTLGGTAVEVVDGLTPGATFYFCIIASNSYGTSFGSVLSFTLPPAHPDAFSTGSSSVTATSATLEGSANPFGGETTAWFQISETNSRPCYPGDGTRVPAVGGSDVGSGLDFVDYAQIVTGLMPGRTYYFCALAQNSTGSTPAYVHPRSEALSFTTPFPPTVTTQAAEAVAATTATLRGTANPNGVATTAWFRYSTKDPGACGDAFGTRAPAVDGTALGGGASDVGFLQGVAGLAPATTYYACAVAASLAGTTFGDLITFTTAADAPTAVTSPATSIADTAATLNGAASPNGDNASGWFRYATTEPGTCDDTFGTRVPSDGGTTLGGGNTPVPFSQPLSGLTKGTTIYFCAVAANGLGTSYGAVQAVLPGSTSPIVTTEAATTVSTLGASLQGTANPRGTPGTGWFRYGTLAPSSCDDAYGTRAPASGGAALGAGSSSVPFGETIAGLQPNETYYYCAAASNAGGASFGDVLTVTTAPLPPTVVISSATAGSDGVATLEGLADPRGAATTTWFRTATGNPGTCNDTFGTRWPGSGGAAIGSGRSIVGFSEVTTALPKGDHFACAIASSAGGLAFSQPLHFYVGQADPPSAPEGCGCSIGAEGGEERALLLLALMAVLAPRLRPQRRANG